MGENRFLTIGSEEFGDEPRRVFARVDQIDGEVAFLDAVDAAWFEAAFQEVATFETWRDRAVEAPIYVFELSSRFLEPLFSAGLFANYLDKEGQGEPDLWLEIAVGNAGLEARIYHNLFGEARTIRISQMRPASEDIARKLSSAFSLDAYEVGKSDIENALTGHASGIEWIGVYDVGQGSANGLCDVSAMPRTYFDLGGGVLGNAHTFSPLLQNFCFTQNPPVLLSHWDWDHWSSGARFPAAGNMDWIVPNQALGAVHATFAAGLAAKGKLRVWPNTLPSVSVGQLQIVRCQGKGRNHSGLAVEVAGPRGEAPILLGGDARYNVVPGALNSSYTSVVVPHHGADMRNRATPVCPRLPASRAAYSCGVNNSFGHPRNVTERDHDGSGWDHQSRHKVPWIDRNTMALRPVSLGHIGLTWGANHILPPQPCGGSLCSLQLNQS